MLRKATTHSTAILPAPPVPKALIELTKGDSEKAQKLTNYYRVTSGILAVVVIDSKKSVEICAQVIDARGVTTLEPVQADSYEAALDEITRPYLNLGQHTDYIKTTMDGLTASNRVLSCTPYANCDNLSSSVPIDESRTAYLHTGYRHTRVDADVDCRLPPIAKVYFIYSGIGKRPPLYSGPESRF